MDRRNFLAFIPSLAAVPFIGKHIEQTKSGIFIEAPKPAIIKDLSRSPIDSFKDLEVRLYANGKHVGNAYIEQIHMHHDFIETTCRDTNIYPTVPTIDMQCKILNPYELIDNII